MTRIKNIIKTLTIILVFNVVLTNNIKADTIPDISLTSIAQVNQGNSYITFPTDIGDIVPLWFEANLIPNFHVRTSKTSRLMGVLTPQIVIRMLQEKSYPIKTPSYIPQLTMYYKISKENKNNTAYFRLAHHSNGQDGDFYLPDGSINLVDGNFATNYIEAGFIRIFYNKNYNANQFFKTSVIKHFLEEGSEEKGIYSTFRLLNTLTVFKISQAETKKAKKKPGFSFKIESEIMFGDVYSWDEKLIDRVNVGITAFYAPKFLEDMGFFIQVYHGQDYYNINFDNQINVIRFGLMTEVLRF